MKRRTVRSGKRITYSLFLGVQVIALLSNPSAFLEEVRGNCSPTQKAVLIQKANLSTSI